MSEDDDFDIPASDDELAASESWDAEHKNYVSWEPPPADIASLYEKLEKDGVIELQMTCLPRRAPTPKLEEQETKEAEKEQEKTEETPGRQKPADLSFDFDLETPVKTFTPTRRTPGSRPTPRSGQRRVARMDNIMSSIMRHRRQDTNDTPVKPTTSKDSEKKTDNTEGKAKNEGQKQADGKEGDKGAPPAVSTDSVKQEPVDTPATPQRPPSRTRSRRT